MSNQPTDQNPELIRQWMSQNLMTVSSSNQQQPYPQIDPRILNGQQQTYYQSPPPQQQRQQPQHGQQQQCRR
ncbi:hypothetical protein EX30DRAFT_371146 [Ascodesmis nigricans]|uniref:Uncharacterized protein n=1 Tax=Ascodesmis nigricans TaxID=341454 RepID=A0A4S2MZ74_9PEZI|nr:hypothetical protein EX30DRAFT_371146 [Ascodesmis nigricans]